MNRRRHVRPSRFISNEVDSPEGRIPKRLAIQRAPGPSGLQVARTKHGIANRSGARRRLIM